MLYDITPEITEKMPVWPGDTPPTRSISSEIALGARTTNSIINTTVHLGAHADAPSHYLKEGRSIEQQDLNYYLGPCQVIRVQVDKGKEITKKHIHTPILAERVLFATDTFMPGEDPQNGFAAFSNELIDWLHEKGVITIGIDVPSVDLFGAQQLLSHAACGKNDMAILENLDLSSVPEGVYELIALPLKLKGFDASPIRAILRTLTH